MEITFEMVEVQRVYTNNRVKTGIFKMENEHNGNHFLKWSKWRELLIGRVSWHWHTVSTSSCRQDETQGIERSNNKSGLSWKHIMNTRVIHKGNMKLKEVRIELKAHMNTKVIHKGNMKLKEVGVGWKQTWKMGYNKGEVRVGLKKRTRT